MAKSQGQVTKIYELRTMGYQDLSKQLDNVAKKFETIKRAKLATEGKLLAASDISDLKKYSDALAKLKVEEQGLRTERARMINDQKAQNIARQEAIRLQREEAKGAGETARGYNLIYQQYKELYKLVKNSEQGDTISFRGQSLQFDEAIAKLKQLAAAEQDFRRQFARDGLLVAEYTSGIVQAFKQMGLEDLVAGQITKAQTRLKDLNKDFDKLQQELSETKVAGDGSLEHIEKQLVENRKEAISLTREVTRLKNEFRGAGDVGNQITASIQKGFAGIKGQVGSLALQYIGFTALFNKITGEISQGISEASKIEGVTAAFENLNRPGLLDNLRQATRGTVSDLELMQRAVQASNFQIPLEQMGTLLDFARRRAKDTGQEVNYLVDSIITGIGRKSPLILDNLGISAVRLREKLKGVSEETVDIASVARAVGDIITEENKKLGKEVDTTTERLAQNKAEWQNIRAEFVANLLPALATLGSAFLFLITNLPVIITLIAVLAAGWAVANAQLVLQNANLLYYNLLIARNYVALGILSVAQLAYNSALFVLNGLLRVVTAGMRIFGITAATATGPLRIFLTVASLLGAALLGISRAMGEGTAAISEHTRRLRAQNEVSRDASRIYTEQISRINSWMTIIRSATISADTKMRAMRELIKENNAFSVALKENVIDMGELEKAYERVTTAIVKQARAQASANLTAKKQQAVTNIATARQELEIATAGGRDFFIDTKDTELPDEVVKILETIQGARVIKSLSFSGGKTIAITQQQLKKALDDLTKKETEASQEVQRYFEIQVQADKDLADFLGQNAANATAFEVDIAKLRKEIEAITKEIDNFQGSEKDLTKKLEERRKLQDRLDALLGNTKDKSPRSSRLTAQQKDLFKDIDAIRDRLLAEQTESFERGVFNEETYLNEILYINQQAIDRKLKLLKGSTPEERKQIAQLSLERIKLEKETNDKIFELRAKLLKEQLETTIANAQEQANLVINDPNVNVSATARAQAQLEADQTILAAQVLFNEQMDKLEQDRNLASQKNAEDRARVIRAAQATITEDERKLILASIDDIKTIGERLTAEFELAIDKAILLVQADNRLTDAQKKSKIRILENQREFGIMVRQAAMYKSLEREFKKAYEAGIVTLAQYEEIVKKLGELQQQIAESPQKMGKGFFDGVKFDFGEDIISFLERAGQDFGTKLFPEDDEMAEQYGRAIGEAITQSYSLAQDVMNNYFDAERQRIMDNLELQLERLDIEKEQVQARAQSQEEIDSLEKQYAAKKKAEEKKAQEALKRSKKSEAKIALAAELANIWASVWQLGPIAGPIAGAIFSGFALGRYALRVNEINREKFEFGGKPGEVPTRGGQFGGKSHAQGGTDFDFNGKKYNAEVKEVAVIRTKNAPKGKKFTVSGTQMEIASAINKIGGGRNFKPGATLKMFESGGYLGQGLQPPVFQAAGNNTFLNAGGVTEEKMDELIAEMRRNNQEQSARIDRLKVEQVTSTVTNAQKKQVQQSAIGTL